MPYSKLPVIFSCLKKVKKDFQMKLPIFLKVDLTGIKSTRTIVRRPFCENVGQIEGPAAKMWGHMEIPAAKM
jgi:hypothetical protein